MPSVAEAMAESQATATQPKAAQGQQSVANLAAPSSLPPLASGAKVVWNGKPQWVRVHLPGSQEKVVKASNEDEAWRLYKRMMGVRTSDRQPVFFQATEPTTDQKPINTFRRPEPVKASWQMDAEGE